MAEYKVTDLNIHYAGVLHAQAELLQGTLMDSGEMVGMLGFFIKKDGGVVGVTVPQGFTRMKTPFKGFFIMAGGSNGGATPVKCTMSSGKDSLFKASNSN